MNPNVAIIRRPLTGTVAALLLLSACGTAAQSTPTPIPNTQSTNIAADAAPDTTNVAQAPTAISTTVDAQTPPVDTQAPIDPQPTATQPPAADPPATDPPFTEPVIDSVPVVAVDVSSSTIFGIGVFEAVDVDAVATDVSAQLGAPTTDSGWLPTVGQSCAGSTDARVLWWGDFRLTFERYQGNGDVRDELSAWTVGDPTVFELAPIGDVPAAQPSNIVTGEGIGLGSTLAEIQSAWQNVNNGGGDQLVVVDRGGTLVIRLDNGGQVVGFGNGPFDCPVDETR